MVGIDTRYFRNTIDPIIIYILRRLSDRLHYSVDLTLLLSSAITIVVARVRSYSDFACSSAVVIVFRGHQNNGVDVQRKVFPSLFSL